MAEEAEKEHKKMVDKVSLQADEMKLSYKKLVTEVQSSLSRVFSSSHYGSIVLFSTDLVHNGQCARMIVEDLQGRRGAGGRDGRRCRWRDEQLEQESDAELGWGLLGDAYDRCGEVEHELKHSSPALHSCNLSVSPSYKSTWTWLSKEAFHDILSFMKLAVPSALMVFLEWWSFVLLVLLSGLLANPKLEASVLSICLNTTALTFMMPFGLGAAIRIRVSNELGTGRPEATSLATRVTMVLGLVAGVSLGLIMLSGRNLWGYAYINEKEVVEYIARMMPLLSISIIFDDLQCVLSD
ncbi:Protein TRANSPARENT TESTA 12 [Hordeum vulgare]|nr:Protein TRANSPARENT TESTA 12 [Hordeum vulgare]